MKVAIIGGGASGVLAAIRLKEINKLIDVTIYERENKILAKVFRSGNGRANFGNLDIKELYYTNQDLIIKMQDYLNDHNLDDSNQFFENHGLFTYTDNEGRLYPLANDSKSLVSLLEYLLFLNRVKVLTNKNINEIKKVDDKYQIEEELYDYVIISIGSNASLNVTEKEQYKLINNLDLELTNLEPGLTGFKCYNNFESLFGMRAKVRVMLDNMSSYGEIIFKEDGVSGICLMNLANYYQKQDYILVNFFPDYEFNDLCKTLLEKLKFDPNMRLYNLLIGCVNNKLINYINKKYDNVLVSSLTKEQISAYVNEFYNFKLSIKEKYDYKNSQIILGGINDLERDFFELKKQKNMYVTGEIINNAGICGGYNLWFAFTSGLIVANMIGEKYDS